MRFRRIAATAAALISAAVVAACSSSGSAGSSAAGASGSSGAKPTIVVAAPECAHCLAMALLDSSMIPGYNVKFESFGTLTELTAGLASGAIDVGQIDYTGLVSFIDKNLPIVAVSGEVNGGSDFVLSPSVKLP